MKLYKLTNELGEYFVIANDPTEAEVKLKKVLDYKDGYGFTNKRIVKRIDLIAKEITFDERFGYSLTNNFLLT